MHNPQNKYSYPDAQGALIRINPADQSRAWRTPKNDPEKVNTGQSVRHFGSSLNRQRLIS